MCREKRDLQPLRLVSCRTQAEYETLLHLLTADARAKWSKRIGLGAKGNLHYRRWNYVEQVKLDSKSVAFRFNPTPTIRGPFAVRAEFLEEATNKVHFWEDGNYTLDEALEIRLGSLEHYDRYSVRLTLDGRVAYANRYANEDLPF